jgi:hypothetical protein
MEQVHRRLVTAHIHPMALRLGVVQSLHPYLAPDFPVDQVSVISWMKMQSWPEPIRPRKTNVPYGAQEVSQQRLIGGQVRAPPQVSEIADHPNHLKTPEE